MSFMEEEQNLLEEDTESIKEYYKFKLEKKNYLCHKKSTPCQPLPYLPNIRDEINKVKGSFCDEELKKIEFELEQKGKEERQKKFENEQNKIEDGQKKKFLINVLIEKLSDENMMKEAIKELGNSMDSSAVEPLIKTFINNDRDIRYITVEALRKIQDKRTFFYLVEMLEDEKSLIREYAVEALEQLGDMRAVYFLIKKGLIDKNHNVFLKVLKALITLNDPQAIEPIKEVKKKLKFFNIKIKKEIDKAIQQLEGSN